MSQKTFSQLNETSSAYRALGDRFSLAVTTTPLNESYLIDVNPSAAHELGLDPFHFEKEEWRALTNGEAPLGEERPFSSYYSGHQFGVWAGQLGDGRTHILGELNGFELQLKGSGLTPFSRMGDGKAVLRSTIREYLASEAMHALGIPTTRALSINGSREPVRRERVELGATMIRVSPSFIRFGTFEHFKSRGDKESLAELLDYVGSRYFALSDATRDGSRFLEIVTEKTAFLIAQWMAYGFCHGVMNTDNMSILGLTLDYGPYGFLENFEPGHICNHSDDSGRYSYMQQPSIAHWNLLALAFALGDHASFESSQTYLKEKFGPLFHQFYRQKMCARAGLEFSEQNAALVESALELMVGRVEYNRFFYELIRHPEGEFIEALKKEDRWSAWFAEYQGVKSPLLVASAMNLNPRYTLKNWVAQEVIEATLAGDLEAVRQARELLQNPYDLNTAFDHFAGPTPSEKANLEVSCSS